MANDVVWTSSSAILFHSLWIPLLIAVLLCGGSGGARSEILLPSQNRHDDSVSSCPATNPDLYYRPVIGIVSHPGDGASGRLSNATNASYIAASYVKFVEAGGARVIPLIYNEPPEKLLKVCIVKYCSSETKKRRK